MTESEAAVIAVRNDQIVVEQDTLNRLVKLEEDAREPTVRLAFRELSLDTWKHIKFLEGLIEHMTTVPCDEWSAKVGRYTARVKLENDMTNFLDRVLEKIDDSVAQLLGEHLKEEEESHLDYLSKWVKLIQQTPLQAKKSAKGTDIVCETE